MNTNMQQILDHYIEKFSYINNTENDENYKWIVAKEFRILMDDALSKEGEVFVGALDKARLATKNMIDNYTQPFYGLVEFAKQEPETVKQMFLDLLYTEDHGDLHVQEKLIDKFFKKSNELLQKYAPDSYRYKQNSHSVSAYLFLYNPEQHYMFKATQAAIFADCIGFYDDWGTGDNIRLNVFYRMCDMLVDAISQDQRLLEINELRYCGEFRTKKERLRIKGVMQGIKFVLILKHNIG